jgi:hypothetical protein
MENDNSKDSNLEVRSNVWICREEPSVSGHFLVEKLKKEIPGDHMLDFIRLEFPMNDPNSRHLIETEMTGRQREEYFAYRFFLPHGSEGWIRLPDYSKK